MAAKNPTHAIESGSTGGWDLYTAGIVSIGAVGIGLIAYSLMFGSAADKRAVTTASASKPVAVAPAASAPAVQTATAPVMVAMAPKPVESKATTALSSAELAQKNAAFDRFFIPPAGCSSPPQAKESPDCGVRYGHARMEFERQWALGQVR
jgi:hypothetical protein